MTEDWGGPQWVLATILVVGMIAPIGRRYAPPDKEKLDEATWWGQYGGILICKAGLVGILYWAGFW